MPPAVLQERLQGFHGCEMQQLGDAMTIKQVAQLVGCSEWTVRNKLVPAGLPHFRFSPSGKLIFFYEQVVAWVLARQNQTKGGNNR
jgi:hypothetical protein